MGHDAAPRAPPALFAWVGGMGGVLFTILCVVFKTGPWDTTLTQLLGLLTASFCLMVAIYDIAHFSAHYMPATNGVLKFLKKHHMLHHFDDHSKRFGVTSPFWDFVFGTFK